MILTVTVFKTQIWSLGFGVNFSKVPPADPFTHPAQTTNDPGPKAALPAFVRHGPPNVQTNEPSHVRCTWCAWWCDTPAGSVFGSRHAIQGVMAYEMLPHRQLLQGRPRTQFMSASKAKSWFDHAPCHRELCDVMS